MPERENPYTLSDLAVALSNPQRLFGSGEVDYVEESVFLLNLIISNIDPYELKNVPRALGLSVLVLYVENEMFAKLTDPEFMDKKLSGLVIDDLLEDDVRQKLEHDASKVVNVNFSKMRRS